MFLFIVYLSALLISCISGWFSVTGMAAVFAGAPIAAMSFSSALELGKLVCASWLYRHWNDAPRTLKIPLFIITGVLILLTSMGIFGYLSKAHLEQGAPVANNADQIQVLDDKIASEKRDIADAQNVIGQLDKQVDGLVAAERIRGKNGSISLRNGQKTERKELSNTITDAQKNIDVYVEQRSKLSSELKKVEMEIGPIKYLAQMLYGDSEKELDKAVRILILIIVLVFDPLAILLLIAANHTQRMNREKKENPMGPPVVRGRSKTLPRDSKPVGNTKKSHQKNERNKNANNLPDTKHVPVVDGKPPRIPKRKSKTKESTPDRTTAPVHQGNEESNLVKDAPNVTESTNQHHAELWTSPKNR
jgi:hypothetical protein